MCVKTSGAESHILEAGSMGRHSNAQMVAHSSTVPSFTFKAFAVSSNSVVGCLGSADAEKCIIPASIMAPETHRVTPAGAERHEAWCV